MTEMPAPGNAGKSKSSGRTVKSNTQRPKKIKPAEDKPKPVSAKPKVGRASARPRSIATESVAAQAAAGKTIDQLDLAEPARSGALLLKDKFPDIVFTSGRRKPADQARAMAGNIVRVRDYIRKTYTDTPEHRALQHWVDANPQAKTASAIAAGLLGVMNTFSGAQLAGISRHIVGQAFDVQPLKTNAAAIKAFMKGLPHRHKFFDKEAGLEIWHVDFA